MNHRSVLAFVILLAGAACTTVQAGIERTPTPDLGAVGTLANLILEGTQIAQRATEMALPVTPTPITGSVTGQICYPGDRIPPMTIYFWNTGTNEVVELETQTNQARYRLDLPPGEYLAFAWVTAYQIGGLYSNAVPCGLLSTCRDHDPAPMEVRTGETVTGIDLCDWPFPASSLPLPPDFSLPGEES